MNEQVMKPEQQFALFVMLIVGIVAVIVVAVVLDKKRTSHAEA